MLKSQKDGGEVEHLQETSINRFLYKTLRGKMPEYPIINKKTGEQIFSKQIPLGEGPQPRRFF